MKRLYIIILNVFVVSLIFAQPKLAPDNIGEIVKAMTLEEKARMVNGIGTFWAGDASLRNWRDIPGLPGGTYEISRLGIPCIYFGDGPLGIKMNENRLLDSQHFFTTAEPVPLLLASSWNPQIVYEIAQDIGEECRDYGVDILLGPSINIIRNPLCGRNHEYYSEDPFLAGEMSSAFIKGIQSVGIGATVKHFAANNQESNKVGNNAIISQRALREIYLKPFEMSVQASPWCFMTSYNAINGTTTSENYDLLTTILRKDWKYDGLVVSDWGAGFHPTLQIKAGNNLIQPGNSTSVEEIIKAVKDGRLSEKSLNESVTRILQLVVKCHSFKHYIFPNHTDLKSHQLMARIGGGESAILLENKENTLPLRKGRNVAIYGRTAYHMIAGGIGEFEYNGANRIVTLAEAFRKTGYNVDFNLAKKYFLLGPNQHLASWLTTDGNKTDIDEHTLKNSELKAEARSNDFAIIVLGHVASEGTDRPRSEFYFTKKEKELLTDVCQAYHAVGKKVILLLNIPAQMDLESIKNFPDAILCVFQGGEEMGNWIVDLLTGRITPSGKLPVTFAKELDDYPSSKNFPILEQRYEVSGMMKEIPTMKTSQDDGARRNLDFTQYKEGIYVGYRYFDTFKKDVTYPFGYGLSYTTFKYDNPSITLENGVFTISVNVTNTGKYKGKEIVELFYSAPQGGIEKPRKELVNFIKTKTLVPGETQKVHMLVPIKNLASFDESKSAWIVEKGIYQFHIATNANEIKSTLQGQVDKTWTKKVSNALPLPKNIPVYHKGPNVTIIITIAGIISLLAIVIMIKYKKNRYNKNLYS